MSERIGNRMYPEDLDDLSLSALIRQRDAWQALMNGWTCKLKKRQRKLAFRQVHRIKKRVRTESVYFARAVGEAIGS